MKRPSTASLKRLNAENLAALGAEELARILLAISDGRPELKRRLRMELAAAQGPEPLAIELDKRLATLTSSRSKISWRTRPAFVRDLDEVRQLIGNRLAELDRPAAAQRMLMFLNLRRHVAPRVKDKDGEIAA